MSDRSSRCDTNVNIDDCSTFADSDEPTSFTDGEGHSQDGPAGSCRRRRTEETNHLKVALNLGLDPSVDSDLMWLVQEAFAMPLPASWMEHADAEGRVYYCNQATQESSWSHPADTLITDMVSFLKPLRTEWPPLSEAQRKSALEEHLLQARQHVHAQLADWSGPYDSSMGPYYYNSKLDISMWENPVKEGEADLATRQRVLTRCLFQEWPFGDVHVSGMEAPVLQRRKPPPLTGLEPLSDPEDCSGLSPRTPSSTRSFYSACSGPCSGRSTPSLSSQHRRRRRSNSCTLVAAELTSDTSPQLAELVQTERLLVSARSSSAVECGLRLQLDSALATATCAPAPLTQHRAAESSIVDIEAAIEAFAKDTSREALELPTGLSAERRRTAKAFVDRQSGLTCESFGFGAERRVHVFRKKPSRHSKTANLGTTTSAAAIADFEAGECNKDLVEKSQDDSQNSLEFTFGSVDALQLPQFWAVS